MKISLKKITNDICYRIKHYCNEIILQRCVATLISEVQENKKRSRDSI